MTTHFTINTGERAFPIQRFAGDDIYTPPLVPSDWEEHVVYRSAQEMFDLRERSRDSRSPRVRS